MTLGVLGPPPTATVWLRSWAYTILFLLWCLIAAIGLLPFLIRQSWTHVAIRIWVGGIMALGRWVAGVDYRVEGREHLPAAPCIVAPQHQSAYETYRIFLELDRPVLVLKRELVRIPFIGWYMSRSGLVSIDRSAGASAMRKALRAAKAALAAGRHVVIFPEGTRAPPGVVLPLQPGIAALYLYCGVPVIPAALNSGYFWGKTRVLKRPGVITLRFLEALPGDLDKDRMLSKLHARISAAARSLPAWDRPPD